MEGMNSKTKRTAMLMNPTTPFEKFFSRWVVSTIVFVVVYFLAFLVADYIRVLGFAVIYPKMSDALHPTYIWNEIIEELSKDHDASGELPVGMLFFTGYWFTQSLFVLGSAVWPKNSFVKTFAAVAAVCLIYIATGAFLNNILRAWNYVFKHTSDISDHMLMHGFTCFFAVFTLVNWTIAYFRFKESEVINRM
jgi:hypothetical protein